MGASHINRSRHACNCLNMLLFYILNYHGSTCINKYSCGRQPNQPTLICNLEHNLRCFPQTRKVCCRRITHTPVDMYIADISKDNGWHNIEYQRKTMQSLASNNGFVARQRWNVNLHLMPWCHDDRCYQLEHKRGANRINNWGLELGRHYM